MAQDVRCDPFGGKRRLALCCGRGVLGDEGTDRISCQGRAPASGEERVFRASRALVHPGLEKGHTVGAQRSRAGLSSFAATAHMRTGAQLDVAVAQASEL